MEKFEHGGNVYAEPPQGGKWLDFSANINPLGLAPAAAAAIQENIAGIIHYPDPSARELKAAISRRYQVPEEELILGNGAAELFYLLLHMVRPRRVGIPVPSFSEYQRAAEAVGAEVVFSPLRAEEDFRVDLERLKQDLQDVDCIFLGNPNNPTGQLLLRQQLEAYLHFWESCGIWTVVDESFLDFLPADEKYSVRNLVGEYRHLLVVRSLTKFYAMPGLRLGFASGHRELVKHLEKGKDVWNVNSLAQAAGVAALALTEYHKKSREFVQAEKDWFYKHLLKLRGVRPLPPSVNFIMAEVADTGMTSSELVARLRSAGILLRDCGNYTGLEGCQYVRVAVRTRQENERLLQAWEAIL